MKTTRDSLRPVLQVWATSIKGIGVDLTVKPPVAAQASTLAAGIPVTTTALDLGYSTASSFINLFRRTFGETLSAYRQRL